MENPSFDSYSEIHEPLPAFPKPEIRLAENKADINAFIDIIGRDYDQQSAADPVRFPPELRNKELRDYRRVIRHVLKGDPERPEPFDPNRNGIYLAKIPSPEDPQKEIVVGGVIITQYVEPEMNFFLYKHRYNIEQLLTIQRKMITPKEQEEQEHLKNLLGNIIAFNGSGFLAQGRAWFVDPAYQERHYGSALNSYAMKMARDMGYWGVILRSSYDQGNSRLKRMSKKNKSPVSYLGWSDAYETRKPDVYYVDLQRG